MLVLVSLSVAEVIFKFITFTTVKFMLRTSIVIVTKIVLGKPEPQTVA